MRYQSKYYNVKTRSADGTVFDSHKEAMRYEQLLMLQKVGEISNLQRQVPFELIPAQYESFERYGKNGKRLKDGKRCIEKSVVYIADFVYNEDGKKVVEDVKSAATKKKESYILKRKMLLWVYGIKLRET